MNFIVISKTAPKSVKVKDSSENMCSISLVCLAFLFKKKKVAYNIFHALLFPRCVVNGPQVDQILLSSWIRLKFYFVRFNIISCVLKNLNNTIYYTIYTIKFIKFNIKYKIEWILMLQQPSTTRDGCVYIDGLRYIQKKI